MKIVVLVKVVPDTYGDRKLDLTTGLADRSTSEAVIDEINERALEVALSCSDVNLGTEVVVVSMGPASIVTSLRKCLAMGATSAVHVLDDRLAGSDHLSTADALAAAIRLQSADLVIAGNRSTDGSGGVVPAMIAELLGVPQLTNLSSVQITSDAVTGERASDSGTMLLSSSLPAVISVTEQMPDARFSSFKGIMAAKKKPIDVLSVAELGVEPESETESHSIVISLAERPARTAGAKVVDEGDAGTQLADYLITNRLV